MISREHSPFEQTKAQEPVQALTLDTLGLEAFQVAQLRQALTSPVGAIIVAGSCGTGVSTTVRYLLLEKYHSSKRQHRFVSVVNNDEFNLEAATTYVVPYGVSTRNSAGNPYAQAMRQALRSDPDFVHLGEVRDDESVNALVKLTSSGHQVITEVHAASALNIPTRLGCLGASSEYLGHHHNLSALVYQSLFGVVCEHCAMDLEEAKQVASMGYEKEQLARFEQIIDPSLHPGLRFRREAGCDCCRYGVTERTCVAEVIIPDDYLRECFREGRFVEAIAHFRKEGGVTALEHGVSKALRGLVDLRDVEHRLDQLTRLVEYEQMAGVETNEESFVIKVDPLARFITQPVV
jgi:type II secretory ATPase GspE/PulE/Tfp pilus assembly ATPase PilB-like protein